MLKNLIFIPLIFALSLSLPLLAQEQQQSAQPLTGEARFIPGEAQAGEIIELFFELQLEEGYKAYVDQFKVKVLKPEEAKAGQLDISNQFTFYDKFSKSERAAIKDRTSIKALVETPTTLAPGNYELEIALTYQACTEKFCLFPKDLELTAPLQVLNEAGQIVLESSTAATNSSQNGLSIFSFTLDLEQSLWLSFLLVFLAGVLTSFTPCIFPMIPITIAILGRGSSERTRLKNFSLSLVYVLGIALTYAILGVVAASTGAMFGAALSNPVVVGLMSALFIAMAISMYGGFDLQPPAFIRNRFGHAETGQGFKGAFLMGLLAGVVASPCVGPVLVGILTYVAQTQNLVFGFALLFVFALGLGQLFLLLGLSGEVGRFLPRSGPWMDGVKFFFGTIMLGVAFYYLEFLLPQVYWLTALGLALILVSSLFGAFLQGEDLRGVRLVQKGLMLAVFIFGVGLSSIPLLIHWVGWSSPLMGSATTETLHEDWQEYSQEALEAAIASNQPVLIDFYADWCVACKELELYTFSEESFKSATENMLLLRFDATNPSPQLDELSAKYQIVGLPTVLLFDHKGQWRKELTVTGFEEAPEFVKRVKQLQSTQLDQSL